MSGDERGDPADGGRDPTGGDPLFAEAGVLNRTELIRRPELLEISTVPGSDRIAGRTEQIQYVAIDILSALKGEDSHGTAPLGWDI